MKTSTVGNAEFDTSLDESITRVCARVAPTWPLDRFIAVNPFWALVDTPLPVVAAKLRALSGAHLLMPRAWYRQALLDGTLRDEHLAEALEACGAPMTLASLRGLLEQDEPVVSVRALVADVVDAGRDLAHEVSWRSFVTHSISQFCAAFFDEGQARVGPAREPGLYASWRRHALADRSPGLLMGLRAFDRAARELPETARDLTATALATLEVGPAERDDYLWSLLLDQNGWASWCAYRRWTARLEGRDDDSIADLLAVRLAWEWLLSRAAGDDWPKRWKAAKANWPLVDVAAAAARASDWVLQTAMELAWRGPVLRALPLGFRTPRPAAPAVQAVMCIDVRSEVFRRSLEAASPTVQTLGYAGFFGVPMDYQPLGLTTSRPQLPGLLAARWRSTDTGLTREETTQRVDRLELGANWRSFKADPVSSFTFVEALGLTYAGKLAADSLGLAAPEAAGLSVEANARRKPRLVSTVDGHPVAPSARVELAAGLLRGMSLTQGFARLVLLAGHGSSTRNNAHAAGLDCGACCGQTGEVNARAAAALLNEPTVRAGLTTQGLAVPSSTWFVAGLHNTTTDEVELFDLDEVPVTHSDDIETLRAWLSKASLGARAERAAKLGLGGASPSALARAVRARSADWAEVRPEWGLANNAAFIVAPREHCRHLNLEGRSFLHEYRHREDEGFRTLELIMTAPLVVAHWINFQYYASTVDPARYGSGNKLLHNVVGGHLGVFEGNGGDLRIGLPLQSLHDGARWVHTPLRLSVFIEAPRSAIDAVLEKHATVRSLVTNGWLSLFQLDETEEAIFEKKGGAWVAASRRAEPPPPAA